MKRLFIVSLAVTGLAACTSNPYKPAAVEPRKPNAVLQASKDSSANSVDAFLGAVSETSHASIKIGTISEISGADLRASDKGFFGPFSTVAGSASDVAIVGWHLSKKASAVVVVSASEAGKVSDATLNQIFTTSGNVISASVDASRTAFGVSVEFTKESFKDSKELVVKVGRITLGTVKLSAETAIKVAGWTSDKVSEKVSDAKDWSVDASGKLYHGSRELVGEIVDTSGEVVKFIVDGTGKIVTVSTTASVAVIKGSAQSITNLAKDAWELSKKGGKLVTGAAIASARGTVVGIKWSYKGSEKASKFVSDSSNDLFQSEPVDRPDSGSSASAPGASGSQSN